MKLNNITAMHSRADIDDKDVVWAFIVEEFRDTMEGCIEYKSDRFAVYSEHGKLVEVIYEGNVLRIESADHDAALEIAHRLVDPCDEDKESDVYGKIFDPADDPKLRALYVKFYHSNTSDLKCRYKVEHEGKTFEGEFFLDMFDSNTYDDIHYGIDGNPEVPNEHVFAHVFSTDGSDGNTGDNGIEIQVRLNADTEYPTVTLVEAYLWHNNREQDVIENYDTIDNAEIEIINIETSQTIN